MGGECLNTGCVPSKSLLAAAKAAHEIGAAARFGIDAGPPEIDFARVHAYVHRVIAAIAPHDSAERLEALGCRVIRAAARFVDPQTVEVAGERIRARRFVIATGSRPAIPPLEGLERTPYFTNETLFDNSVLPEHLIVIGGGPIGCEMAQAHRRLGAQVTLIDAGPILPRDDPDAVSVVRETLAGEGVALHERTKITRVAAREGCVTVTLPDRAIDGSHLLVAAGRTRSFEGLGLDAAGVTHDANGIVVDARMCTTNRRVYAAGDAAGGAFTHLAAYHASIVLQNVLFRLPAKRDLGALPWVTFTDPELAQIGMTEAQARAVHGDAVRAIRAEFAENDRAQTDAATAGFAKIVTARRGRVLGATIVGRNAGELVLPWSLAIAQKLRVKALASAIVPYPTLSEVSRAAAGQFYAPLLFGARTRMVVKFLRLFG